MGEREFIILCTLMGSDDESFDSPAAAVTVGELIELANDEKVSSESTVYKNLLKLREYGYVRIGIYRGRSLTYYISEAGKNFLANA